MVFRCRPRETFTAQSGATETIVVLPFENRSDHPEFNWIGESFADSLSTLFTKPGLVVITGDERAVAYQRLHLPLTVLPSRATAIKIARELEGDDYRHREFQCDGAGGSGRQNRD